MVIALDDQFIWDSWYVRDGKTFHGYFLKAPRALGDPELRHLNATVGHATSTDLLTWHHKGHTFGPAPAPAWDDYTTWTGSVVKGDDGLWHLYYTGTSHAERALYQRLGHATSTDLHSWTRAETGKGNGAGLILDLEGPNAKYYESAHMTGHWHDRAMRDPWVMKNPDGPGWLMYFTARAAGVAEANAAGCIGFATSDDMYSWHLQPPLFTGGWGQLEVPQVFEAEGHWFCLFCTAVDHISAGQAAADPASRLTGTHYLIGDGPRGPWRIAPGFLDGALPCRRYASRIVDRGDTLMILGFADRPDGGAFVGQVMDPEPVILTADGLLQIAPRQQAAE